MFISERTVRAHVTGIFAKLKVNNRVKAALAILKERRLRPLLPLLPPLLVHPAGSARGR